MSDAKTFEIYFSDLREETKKELLEFYDLESYLDGNFESCPLAILETEDD
jgi:hypothetical protein